MELNSCLFCTSPCPPTSQISVREHLPQVKIEPDILPIEICQISAASTSTLSPPLPLPLFLKKGEGSSTLAEQLEVIFILRNILEVKDDKLCHFLSRLEGGHEPQDWVKVCISCSEVVSKFWMISKQISNLKKEQINIRKELKERIHTTRESFASSSRAYVWKEVREKVLKEFSETSIPPTSSPPISRSEGIEENENNAEMDSQIRMSSNIFLENENTEDNHETLIKMEPSSSEYVITADIHSEEEEMDAELFQFDVKYDLNQNPPDFTQEDNDEIDDNNGNQPSSSPHQNQNTQENRPGIGKRFPLPGLPPSQHPRYIRTTKKTYSIYKCLECSSYATNFSRQFKPHMELHRPGSMGVKCGQCGWLLHPTKVAAHNTHHHPMRKNGVLQPGVKLKRAYYKCGDCGALNSERRKFEMHKELHNSSRGHICPQPGCGWLCSHLPAHHANWHPPDGSSKAIRLEFMMATSEILLE
ncbi:unnamed protein product [Orchesella dallaii]|uniref:C2H2-type domain-containing protein n=1 Tax=Orchesella dallaii TaxID=48710 RepID=A0ABP1RWS2_9HEXA